MTERTRLKEPMRSICIVEGALHRGRMPSSCRDLGAGWRQGRQELAKRGGNSQCHFIILDWPTDESGPSPKRASRRPKSSVLANHGAARRAQALGGDV